MKKIHLCQSVEGALKTWKKSEWKSIAKSNKCTIEEAKESFWSYLREGKQVIPIGEPCEGFSYVDGCPSHEIPDK